MGKNINLQGMTFGRLKVIEFAEYRKRNDGHNTKYWRCLCQCGNEDVVSTANLRSGAVQSCGCLKSERSKEAHTIHGFHSRSEKPIRLYSIWNCMKTRCNNKSREDYKLYGGRGISVCQEWEHDFSKFYDWAIEHGYNDNLTLDRVDPNGNYSPDNCRWATNKEQASNKRNNILLKYNGETKCLSHWAQELGIEKATLSGRIKRGWSIEKSLNTPVRKIRRFTKAKALPIPSQGEIQ